MKKLRASFVQEGILRYDPIHAIPLIVPTNFYHQASVSKDPTQGEDLPIIEWTDLALQTGSMIAAGGQHRFEALKEWIEDLQNQISRAKAERTRLEDRKDDKPETASALRDVSHRLRDDLRRLAEAGYWIVSVYDHGAFPLNPGARFVHFAISDQTR